MEKDPFQKNKNTLRSTLLVVLFSALYLVWAAVISGIRSDHIFLLAFFNTFYWLNGVYRRFILAFSIFIVYWIIFDTMKLWPNYNFNTVDIRPIYELEKNLFGIKTTTGELTPNEFLGLHQHNVLDVLTGLFYLCWVPVPLLFAFYLFKTSPQNFLHFSLAFFSVNMLGFLIYYLHPAAPPWYVALHGYELDIHTKSYAAGLLRFDKMTGTTLFEGLYAKGSNVFAAVPSLHAAYPVIGFYYSRKLGKSGLTALFFIMTLGIWFSAVYLNHHYVLDILTGLLCAVFGIALFEMLKKHSQAFRKWLNAYQLRISKND